MAKIITVGNQKGGVGKSTTCINLLGGLHKRGYRTLGIDLDAQMCLTTSFKGKTDGASCLSVLLGEATARKAVQAANETDLIPASKGLAQADKLLEQTGKEYLLKEALASLEADYDFIIVDTSPALGVLTINALTAADSLIIPIQADTYSLDGIKFLLDSVALVKKYTNPKLVVEGLLFTMFNGRLALSKEIRAVATEFASNLGSKVFETTIRQAIAVREAQASKCSLFIYAPKAPVTQDYNNLIDGILKEK